MSRSNTRFNIRAQFMRTGALRACSQVCAVARVVFGTDTRELVRHRKVSQSTFDRTSACFGQRGTEVLTNLIACYAVLVYNVNVFEVKAPPATAEPALPV